MKHILVSAMLQSQQCRMPLLHEPMDFQKAADLAFDQKFIAHCLPDEKKALLTSLDHSASRLVLIGPEGDFTPGEIEFALTKNCVPVSLGNTRLRTETAGMTAAVLLSVTGNGH